MDPRDLIDKFLTITNLKKRKKKPDIWAQRYRYYAEMSPRRLRRKVVKALIDKKGFTREEAFKMIKGTTTYDLIRYMFDLVERLK